MTVYLLPEEPVFPPVEDAEPDGLVAVGGDLSANRLLQAYANGIFPWFKDEENIYWFSPDPRMILLPENFMLSDSLKRIINGKKFNVKFNTVFGQVIRGCASVPRPGQDGTWIDDDFIEAYTNLHFQGFAHSIEVFFKEKLVGGLYGVSLGTAFFGESMFFTMSNASKIALYALVQLCRQKGITFIDCQMETPHMQRFGALAIDRKDYMVLLAESLKSKV